MNPKLQAAIARGHPTNAERRAWTNDDWNEFEQLKQRAERDAFNALPDTDSRKLLARIEELEERVRKLEMAQ